MPRTGAMRRFRSQTSFARRLAAVVMRQFLNRLVDRRPTECDVGVFRVRLFFGALLLVQLLCRDVVVDRLFHIAHLSAEPAEEAFAGEWVWHRVLLSVPGDASRQCGWAGRRRR